MFTMNINANDISILDYKKQQEKFIFLLAYTIRQILSIIN